MKTTLDLLHDDLEVLLKKYDYVLSNMEENIDTEIVEHKGLLIETVALLPIGRRIYLTVEAQRVMK